MLLISNQCEMLRGVYPQRGTKGILRFAQNDRINFFSNLLGIMKQE